MKITLISDDAICLDSTESGLTIDGESGRPYTVVYDGHCKICGRLVKVLRTWDRAGILDITSSGTPGVSARFPWIPARAFTESVQVVGPGGTTWQGAAAIERLLDVLPKGRFISWIFSIPFARPLAERFYRWFARNRYHLGCGEHCRVGEFPRSAPNEDT